MAKGHRRIGMTRKLGNDGQLDTLRLQGADKQVPGQMRLFAFVYVLVVMLGILFGTMLLDWLSQLECIAVRFSFGLVYGDNDTHAPNGFHSTITFGPVQYAFFFRLDWKEQIELRLCHPKFYAWVREQVQQAKEQPLSENERKGLGL